MYLDEARDFMGRHHRAVLATRSRDGGIQQSPVLVGTRSPDAARSGAAASGYSSPDRPLRRASYDSTAHNAADAASA